MGISRIAGKVLFHSLALFFAFRIGVSYRDYQLRSNIVVRHGVKVLQSSANSSLYFLQYRSGEQRWFKPCPGLNPHWLPGMILDPLKYEDLGDCKSLAPGGLMGFRVIRDSDANFRKENDFERTAQAR
jgi:hypothetical protein